MKQNPVSQLVLASTTWCFSREKDLTADGKTSGSVLGQRLSIVRRACRLASIALGIYSQNRNHWTAISQTLSLSTPPYELFPYLENWSVKIEAFKHFDNGCSSSSASDAYTRRRWPISYGNSSRDTQREQSNNLCRRSSSFLSKLNQACQEFFLP